MINSVLLIGINEQFIDPDAVVQNLTDASTPVGMAAVSNATCVEDATAPTQ